MGSVCNNNYSEGERKRELNFPVLKKIVVDQQNNKHQNFQDTKYNEYLQIQLQKGIITVPEPTLIPETKKMKTLEKFEVAGGNPLAFTFDDRGLLTKLCRLHEVEAYEAVFRTYYFLKAIWID